MAAAANPEFGRKTPLAEAVTPEKD